MLIPAGQFTSDSSRLNSSATWTWKVPNPPFKNRLDLDLRQQAPPLDWLACSWNLTDLPLCKSKRPLAQFLWHLVSGFGAANILWTDEIHFAPPFRIPGFKLMIPLVNTSKQWSPMVSRWCRRFRPSTVVTPEKDSRICTGRGATGLATSPRTAGLWLKH